MSPEYQPFAGLKVLGLTYVHYVVGFQHIVVKEIIIQVRGKKNYQDIYILSCVIVKTPFLCEHTICEYTQKV